VKLISGSANFWVSEFQKKFSAKSLFQKELFLYICKRMPKSKKPSQNMNRSTLELVQHFVCSDNQCRGSIPAVSGTDSMDYKNEGQIELKMESSAMLTTACKNGFESIMIAMTSKEQYCGKTD
jgi:hypothetical protein